MNIKEDGTENGCWIVECIMRQNINVYNMNPYRKGVKKEEKGWKKDRIVNCWKLNKCCGFGVNIKGKREFIGLTKY